MSDARAFSSPPSAPILEITDLSVGYVAPNGLLQAVRNASLGLDRGMSLGIVGESGSGKSTLGQAAIGYRSAGMVVSSGRILFDGMPLLETPVAALRPLWGRRIAMVHQNSLATLTPTLSIGSQIAEVIRQHTGMGRRAAWDRAIAALDLVSLSNAANMARRYPHELSGGERQRVSIAIALSLEPDLIVLDEPTTNLDATTEAAILDLLEDIRARVDAAMIYISHNFGVIARIATHVAVMYAGEIVETGPTAAIFESPTHPYTRALLACIPQPGVTKEDRHLASIPGNLPSLIAPGPGCIFRERCGTRGTLCDTAPGWHEIDTGHQVRCWYPESATAERSDTQTPTSMSATDTDLLLGITGLTKSYRDPSQGIGRRLHAVKAVNFEIPERSIIGLVGESGSGKSTLLRCIAGLETPEKGGISYLGIDLPTRLAKRTKSMLQSIQMVFQDPESTLNPALTVGENLRRHLRAMRRADAATVFTDIESALQRVRLGAEHAGRYPRELSGGEKQRVAIARAFLSEPRLVLCDEPLSSLDVSVQAAICQLLLDLHRAGRSAYLFVSHDLAIIRYISDEIVVMYLGEVVERGTAESFDRPPLHPYSEALFSAVAVSDPMISSKRIRLSGHISEVERDGSGCIFRARCPRHKGSICNDQSPDWNVVEGRRYRCHWAPDELQRLQEVTS
jgi:peptide/nickel transport system ATP-binding protein